MQLGNAFATPQAASSAWQEVAEDNRRKTRLLPVLLDVRICARLSRQHVLVKGLLLTRVNGFAAPRT